VLDVEPLDVEPLEVEPLDVVALVVTYNSARHLPGLFDSFERGFVGVDRWAVVVADNASSDESVAIARARGARVVATGRNGGYAAGLNAAAGAAPAARARLVLNPDVELSEHCVGRLARALERRGVGIAVPRLVGPDGTLRWSLRRDPTVLRAFGEAFLGGERAGRVAALGELVVDEDRYRRSGPVDWATGAAMLVSSACWEAVGAWDERFFLYSEETDFAIRARRAGFDVWYEAMASVGHTEGESHTSERLAAILASSRVRCFAKHHGRVRAFAFRLAVVVNEAIRAAAGRRTSRAALRQLLRADRP